jgi:hypothetical protein
VRKEKTLCALESMWKASARCGAFLVFLAALVGVPLWTAIVDAAERGAATASWSPLDGRSFNGEMLSGEGKILSGKEKLVFQNGRFVSEACREFGFGDGPYWLRVEDNKIHFVAETVSPTNGTMHWKGTISGGQVDASFVWTKKRWYWTIEREFRVLAVQAR